MIDLAAWRAANLEACGEEGTDGAEWDGAGTAAAEITGAAFSSSI